MKTCPNCGSVLADNEPYCENCGFDPDFDMGSWNKGSRKTTKKPYYHGDHIKSPSNSELSPFDVVGWFFLLVALAFLVGLILVVYI